MERKRKLPRMTSSRVIDFLEIRTRKIQLALLIRLLKNRTQEFLQSSSRKWDIVIYPENLSRLSHLALNNPDLHASKRPLFGCLKKRYTDSYRAVLNPSGPLILEASHSGLLHRSWKPEGFIALGGSNPPASAMITYYRSWPLRIQQWSTEIIQKGPLKPLYHPLSAHQRVWVLFEIPKEELR